MSTPSRIGTTCTPLFLLALLCLLTLPLQAQQRQRAEQQVQKDSARMDLLYVSDRWEDQRKENCRHHLKKLCRFHGLVSMPSG